MTMRYTEDHEWVRIEGDGTTTIGITDHAQDALGDIVFIEMPEVDKHFAKGDAACVVESVKAAADVKMPFAGTIVSVNVALPDDPSKVNTDPMNEGWFLKVKPDSSADVEALMDESAYEVLIKS